MATSKEAIGMLIPQANTILSASLSPFFALPLPIVTTFVIAGKIRLVDNHNGASKEDLLEVGS